MRIVYIYIYIYIYIRHRAAGTVACTIPPKAESSSLPVFQDPVPDFQIQFQLESESGVGVWRPILENPFLGGCRGDPGVRPEWIPTPQEGLPAPKFAYLALSWRSCALSWLILALLGLILSPSCSKMAPSWPNIAQHRAKMNQYGLQEHPQDPQKL